MNAVFRFTTRFYNQVAYTNVNRVLSTEGAQQQMYRELEERENKRLERYSWELKEFNTEDILDKSLLRA